MGTHQGRTIPHATDGSSSHPGEGRHKTFVVVTILRPVASHRIAAVGVAAVVVLLLDATGYSSCLHPRCWECVVLLLVLVRVMLWSSAHACPW